MKKDDQKVLSFALWLISFIFYLCNGNFTASVMCIIIVILMFSHFHKSEKLSERRKKMALFSYLTTDEIDNLRDRQKDARKQLLDALESKFNAEGFETISKDENSITVKDTKPEEA